MQHLCCYIFIETLFTDSNIVLDLLNVNTKIGKKVKIVDNGTELAQGKVVTVNNDLSLKIERLTSSINNGRLIIIDDF